MSHLLGRSWQPATPKPCNSPALREALKRKSHGRHVSKAEIPHTKLLRCEKAAYIKMYRDHQCSIQYIAQLFYRSTSTVQRWLKAAGVTGITVSGAGIYARRELSKLDGRKRKSTERKQNHTGKVTAEMRNLWLEFARSGVFKGFSAENKRIRAELDDIGWVSPPFWVTPHRMWGSAKMSGLLISKVEYSKIIVKLLILTLNFNLISLLFSLIFSSFPSLVKSLYSLACVVSIRWILFGFTGRARPACRHRDKAKILWTNYSGEH